jgi:transcriptional regulator with XRE-family HTH domain
MSEGKDARRPPAAVRADLLEGLAARLARARGELGWTLRQAEKASGVPSSHISKVEKGTIADPAWRIVTALELAYGLPPWEWEAGHAGEEAPRDLYPDWPVRNAISALEEMRDRGSDGPPADEATRIRREVIERCMAYAISVVKGIGEITPPAPVPARIREARIREARVRARAAALREEADRIEDALEWGRPGEDWR